MKTEKRRVGDLGEAVACEFLRRRDFEILERNYLRKWGEIDIVARKNGIMRFIEVKSVSGSMAPVTHGTLGAYRPEENVHPAKLKRLARTMQTYLLEKKLDCDWQLDVVTVRVDEKGRKAHAEMIENVII